jgi:hypothetical protein
MSRLPVFLRLALLAALTTLVEATSHVALFTDAHCQDTYKALDGPNGYPNGTCTDMRRSGEYGSLQIVGLDPGCAGTFTLSLLQLSRISARLLLLYKG